MPTKITAGTGRRTESPNAVMTTLASPTQGATERLSLWRVEMSPGQAGPVHAFTGEQIWHVLDGQATMTIDEIGHELGPGDSIVVAAGRWRQVRALDAVTFVVSGEGDVTVSVPGEETDRGVPPWIR